MLVEPGILIESFDITVSASLAESTSRTGASVSSTSAMRASVGSVVVIGAASNTRRAHICQCEDQRDVEHYGEHNDPGIGFRCLFCRPSIDTETTWYPFILTANSSLGHFEARTTTQTFYECVFGWCLSAVTVTTKRVGGVHWVIRNA